jgi:hypothetical protein
MSESTEKSARTAGDVERRAKDTSEVGSQAPVVAYGRLPVSEFAYDRAGAGSPFGDDQRLPLPHDRITYVHPVESDGTPVHF